MKDTDMRKQAYAKFAAHVHGLTHAIESDDPVKEMQFVDALIRALESIKDSVNDGGTTN